MSTVYISGPMRGKPNYNFETFMSAEESLRAFMEPGDGILNPARNFDGDTTREVTEYMQADMEMVLRSDALVLLPGWQASEGAQREVQLATWTGKDFYQAKQAGNCWSFESIPTPTMANSPRADALAEATQLITGDRNNAYGPPTQDFTRTAAMATAWGFCVNGEPIQAHHVAIFMILLKMSRLYWSPAKRDSWVDTAGYAGCGYECALEEAKGQ